jgi:hypothetical protein
MGTYTWPDGGVYIGQVSRGLRHGQGVQTFADSATVYDGEWKNGMRHGVGRLSFDAVGRAHYAGGWAHDKKSGAGRMVYATGNWYDGHWVADVKNGHGRMGWITSGESYEGQWVDGRAGRSSPFELSVSCLT